MSNNENGEKNEDDLSEDEVLENDFILEENKSKIFEKNIYLAESKNEKVEITRFKGLGEINEKEFAHFIDENIRLEQITIDEAEDIQSLLAFYMGANSDERQRFIVKNLRSPLELDGIN